MFLSTLFSNTASASLLCFLAQEQNMQSVTTWKKGKTSSEAESFKHMKINI
jgi:hypothetical protein